MKKEEDKFRKELSKLKSYLFEVHPLIYILILILFLSFYWFQYRPSSIRSECAKSALKHYAQTFNEYDALTDTTGDFVNDGRIPTYISDRLKKDRDKTYENCLHLRGI